MKTKGLPIKFKVKAILRLAETNEPSKCDECKHGASDVWLCLQSCCSFVGCGRLSNNHIQGHHQKTDHAVYLCKNDQQVWCFSCGCKLDEVQLSFSQDIEDCQDDEYCNSDDNETPYTEEDAAMIDKDYFDGFEKGMKPRGLTGLCNIGNTCYMNSALQALSNSPSLMQFFLDCPGYVKCLPQAKLSEHYRLLVTEMWSKKRAKSITPSEFLQCVQKLSPQFRGYRQQDAQEFLRVLMDLLHEELKEPVIAVATSQEHVPRRKTTTKSLSPKSKRLLGGRTVVGMPADNPVTRGLKKPKPNKYNLRSFSRRKAGAQRAARKKDPTLNVPGQEHRLTNNGGTSLNTSQSCPDLSQDKYELSFTTTSKEVRIEPKEPALSLGFVNMASESAEEPGEDTPAFSASLREGRAVSDSEINYCEPRDDGKGRRATGTKSSAVEYSSIISDLFNGKIRSSVQCLTCQKISSTMETFQDLSLPIPGKEELSAIHSTTQCNPITSYSSRIGVDSKGIIRSIYDWFSSWIFGPQVSFEDCLAAFFSADELKGDNMYRCEHCSMLRNGIKECRVYKLPEMLCIHLKRFRHEFYHSSKISSFISFPLEALDMKRYLTSDFTGNCTKYDLVAIITHHGSVGGGHYVAYCKNFVTGKWYEFNDSYVCEVSATYVQNAEAYVLFYRKRGESITKYRQKIFRMSRNAEDRSATHYVSKKWMTMFYTCAEPGPICNSSFLCKHGAVDPLKEDFLRELVTPLPEPCWEFLLKKFGGGPDIKTLTACPDCEREILEMDRRRVNEFKTLKELFDNSDSSGQQYFISPKWFKEWRNFVDGVNEAPPGPINNQKIGLQPKQVAKPVWDFLYAIYGGKPVLAVDKGQYGL